MTNQRRDRPAPSRESPRVAWKRDPLRKELLALYGQVDALLAPFSCDQSTDCCRFGVTGREPYPTAAERVELEVAIAATGAGFERPGTPKKREAQRGEKSRTPDVDLKMRLPVVVDERRCPLLDAAGRCRVYASRPFGCRTFFCSNVAGPGKLPREAIGALSRRIADISARYAPRDPAPRALTNVLDDESMRWAWR